MPNVPGNILPDDNDGSMYDEVDKNGGKYQKDHPPSQLPDVFKANNGMMTMVQRMLR
jgi:hypothetical protein